MIARALQRDRNERYPSADDMLADLDAVQRESRALATKTRATTGVWLGSPERARPERYRTLVYAIIAALAGFSVAAYFITRGSAPSEPQPSPAALPLAAAPLAATPSALPPSPPATAAPTAGTDAKPSVKVTQSKPHDAARPPHKKPVPAASAGVAGSLGLSTREP